MITTIKKTIKRATQLPVIGKFFSKSIACYKVCLNVKSALMNLNNEMGYNNLVKSIAASLRGLNAQISELSNRIDILEKELADIKDSEKIN